MIEDSTARLSFDQFDQIRTLIHERCGIHFNDDVYEHFSLRLQTRLNHLMIQSFSDYMDILTDNIKREEECKELIEIFVNRETYFFREYNQLKLFTGDIIDSILERKHLSRQRRIKIWSAGCATGEEPYSIAIMLRERNLPSSLDIDILGFDISEKSIRRAKQGLFREASFRHIAPDLKEKYFTGTGTGEYSICDSVKTMVTFIYKNMLISDDPDLIGLADVIFCRNVMIYFDTDSRHKLVSWCYNHLVPGGYLLLGHSESLLNMDTPFEDQSLNNEIVYQKPDPVTD